MRDFVDEFPDGRRINPIFLVHYSELFEDIRAEFLFVARELNLDLSIVRQIRLHGDLQYVETLAPTVHRHA